MRAVRGRDAELKVLRELVGAVSGGAGGVVRIEGPVGIGKSKLLTAALQTAGERDSSSRTVPQTSWTR